MQFGHPFTPDVHSQCIEVVFRNNSGVEIPAGGYVEIEGLALEQGATPRQIYDVKRLTSVLTTAIGKAGKFRIANGKYGPGYIGLMLPDAGAVPGEWYKPVPNSFTVVAGDGPIMGFGGYVGMMMAGAPRLMRYRLKADWSASGGGGKQANCDIFDMDLVDTGQDRIVFDRDNIFETLGASDYGYCIYQFGKFYAIQAPCPTGGA